jgi:hypothetical protein
MREVVLLVGPRVGSAAERDLLRNAAVSYLLAGYLISDEFGDFFAASGGG